MNKISRSIAHCSAAALMGIAALGHADDGKRTAGFNLELAPYLWVAGIDGKVSARGQSVSFDKNFSGVTDHVDAGLMGLGVMSYDRFLLLADYDFIGTGNDAKTKNGVVVPIGTKVRGNIDATISTIAVGYRFDMWGDNTIDVLVGSRRLSLDGTLEFPTKNLNNKNDISDTIVMLRPSFQLSENWRFNPTLSHRIAGDSDTSYELTPQFQYQFSKNVAARIGYKSLHYKQNNGSKGTNSFKEFDGSISGPFIGIGWTYPERTEPVVAPAPPPPPPPVAPPPPPPAPVVPVKCSDADQDGVCDADDQCPNTPAGTRVGPAGCDCDYTLRTHFAFDSSEITAADKAALDKLAEMLNNPKLHFVAGEIEGHTDSVGTVQYNDRLSHRRADAVAGYLAAKGLALGDRFITHGYGESKPIADNKTDEGRAENRRVTIRRTDCGPAAK